MRLLALSVPVLLVACDGGNGDKDTSPLDDTGIDSGIDSGETADTGEDTGETADTAPDPTLDCAALGLPSVAFIDATDDAALGAFAADFTVETTAGPWNLKERWSGCFSILVIPDQPRQATGWPDELWEQARDNRDLFEALPKNVEVFFVSDERDDKDRAAIIDEMAGRIENAQGYLEPDDQAWWALHTHFITERARSIDGWLGDTLQDPNWGTAIDRFQKIRYIGSFADPTRYLASEGWFEPNIEMAANEPAYYNFEAEREARLEAQGATVLTLFNGEEVSDPSWAGVTGEAWVDLPDAATMATFDTAEFDHALLCVGEGEYGTCPAWDYLNWAYLCDVEDSTVCTTEIGRWITTYHREGRWVTDVTGILPLIKDGGRRRIVYYTQQPYNVYLSLRLYNVGRDAQPDSYIPMWTGGNFFGETYNDRDPMTVTIPADATKVELYSVISGHGGEAPYNCAEFCETDHHFYVNGTENVRTFEQPGDNWGCMNVVGTEGTVPNQYGTWWYGRNGWCPGKDVPAAAIDITDQIVPGAENIFDYEGYYEGQNYPSTGATLLLTSWLVISR